MKPLQFKTFTDGIMFYMLVHQRRALVEELMSFSRENRFGRTKGEDFMRQLTGFERDTRINLGLLSNLIMTRTEVPHWANDANPTGRPKKYKGTGTIKDEDFKAILFATELEPKDDNFNGFLNATLRQFVRVTGKIEDLHDRSVKKDIDSNTVASSLQYYNHEKCLILGMLHFIFENGVKARN